MSGDQHWSHSNAPQTADAPPEASDHSEQGWTPPCVFSRQAIITDFRQADCDLSFDGQNSECSGLRVEGVTFDASPLSDPQQHRTGVFLDRTPLLPFYEKDSEGDDVALTMELRSSHYLYGDEVMQFGGNGQLYVFIDDELVVSQEPGELLTETTVDLSENPVDEGIHEVSIFFARQGNVRPEFFATLPVGKRECPAP